MFNAHAALVPLHGGSAHAWLAPRVPTIPRFAINSTLLFVLRFERPFSLSPIFPTNTWLFPDSIAQSKQGTTL